LSLVALSILAPPPRAPPFPYTTLFRSALGILGRDQPIAPAPEDQRRQLQLRDALGENPGPPLSRAREQRPAIAGALHQRDRAIDLLRRHLARIAVNAAKSLLDQAVWQDVLQESADERQPREPS